MISNIEIFTMAQGGLPGLGVTSGVVMLFIPNQPKNASGIKNNSQMKPAL